MSDDTTQAAWAQQEQTERRELAERYHVNHPDDLRGFEQDELNQWLDKLEKGNGIDYQ